MPLLSIFALVITPILNMVGRRLCTPRSCLLFRAHNFYKNAERPGEPIVQIHCCDWSAVHLLTLFSIVGRFKVGIPLASHARPDNRVCDNPRNSTTECANVTSMLNAEGGAVVAAHAAAAALRLLLPLCCSCCQRIVSSSTEVLSIVDNGFGI